MSKNYHHGDLRAALVAKTQDMVREDKVYLIGFRELARQLGVSRSAPYRHFANVEELLAAVAEEGFKVFVEQLEIVTSRLDLSQLERFLELGITYVSFALNNSAHYRLMFDQKFYSKKDFAELSRLAAKAFGILKQSVTACLAPTAEKGEIDKLSHLAWACVHGLSTLYIDGQMVQIKDYQEFTRYSCQRLLTLAH